MLAAGLTILASLLSLLVWWSRRRRSPTPEERGDDVDAMYRDCIESVRRLRLEGRDAEADAMLARLASRNRPASGNWVRDIQTGPSGYPNGNGQRLPADPSQGSPPPAS